MPAPPSTGNHLIVCGDTPLAYRIARELTGRYGETVVVVLADRTKNHGPRLAALHRVTVVEHARLSGDAFTDAGVATARAAALVGWDDLENFHAALRAQELNPELRLVVSAFNRRLGDHISGFFRDCTVLSSSQLAAPALVAAALGEIAPSHVRVSGRTLYVTRRADVPVGQVLCGLAVPDDPADTTQLIAPEDLNGGADLVLAVADGTPRDPLARQRHPVRAALAVARRLVMNKFGVIFGVLFALAVAGFALLAAAGYSPGDVIYLGIMDMTGSALTSTGDSGPEKVAQVLLTVDGMALLPVATAIIVGARLTGQIRGEPRPRGGHVIVVGGGEVGIRVVGGLHDLGFDVALIDHDVKAPAVAFARNLGLPVVIGDASERTLQRAGLDSAIALVSATSTDIVNLETAMQARAMRGEDLRIVLRLFDDDLAQRVQRTVSNVVSRSVSYLAAPAFAVAMLEHKVLRTIAVGRHVLLLADVRVEPGADIAGRPLADLELGGLARVIALQERGALRFVWSPRRDHRLVAGERMIVLATRAGLSTFLAGNRSPVASPLSIEEDFFRALCLSRPSYRSVTLSVESIPTWRTVCREVGLARRHVMSVSEDREVTPAVQPAATAARIADPGPLGLAAFATTTFLLMAVNTHWTRGNSAGTAFIGYALAYGGGVQLLAGMWEFVNRNVFGATAFSTWGAFWIGLFFWLKNSPTATGHDLGWILVAYAIVNSYLLLMSTQVNLAVFGVFLFLETTLIVLAIGNFADGGTGGISQAGGYIGLATAIVAWYTSAAGLAKGLDGKIKIPVGKPLI